MCSPKQFTLNSKREAKRRILESFSSPHYRQAIRRGLSDAHIVEVICKETFISHKDAKALMASFSRNPTNIPRPRKDGLDSDSMQMFERMSAALNVLYQNAAAGSLPVASPAPRLAEALKLGLAAATTSTAACATAPPVAAALAQALVASQHTGLVTQLRALPSSSSNPPTTVALLYAKMRGHPSQATAWTALDKSGDMYYMQLGVMYAMSAVKVSTRVALLKHAGLKCDICKKPQTADTIIAFMIAMSRCKRDGQTGTDCLSIKHFCHECVHERKA